MAPRPFEFSDEIIYDRVLRHWTLAERFVESLIKSSPPNYGVGDIEFSISESRLYLAISSAYQDIARYKDYHLRNPETDKLDATKRCAYLVKWLLKFKPINLVRPPRLEELAPHSLDVFELVNETFAIFVVEVHLSEDVGIDFEFTAQKHRDMLYDLVYREYSVDGWMAFFQLVKESTSNISDCSFLQLI